MTDAARDGPVILFDGVCNLCNGSVQFVVDHDPDGVFRFAPLQSESAQDLLAAVGFDDYDFGTFVLVDGDGGPTISSPLDPVKPHAQRMLGRDVSNRASASI